MANTRVKVKRETLLAKLQAEQDRLTASYEKAAEKHVVEKAAWVSKLADECEAFAALLRSDPEKAIKRTDHYYRSNKGYGTEVHFGTLTYPDRPSRTDTGKIARMIAVLQVADDDLISIASEDEYARYL